MFPNCSVCSPELCTWARRTTRAMTAAVAPPAAAVPTRETSRWMAWTITIRLHGYAFTGVLRSTLDSVQEFRVTTVGFGADSGRSSGAQVSLVTKSGTNQFHGSLYEYNRSSLGEANDWFNKQAELSHGLPNVPGKLIRNTFGASLGGPIKKEKALLLCQLRRAANRGRSAGDAKRFPLPRCAPGISSTRTPPTA